MNVTMKIATALALSASIVGTANAQGKIYGAPAKDAYAMAPTSTATHNGSLMDVYELRGGRLEIRYAEPRPGLANIGVTPGTLLIKGVWVAEKLEGTAYLFTSGCPALPYRVIGSVDRFGNILLSGPIPVTDYACNIVGYNWKNHNAYLRFDQVTER